MNTKKQWIAMLLMLAMLFAALPIAAFAEDPPAEPPVEEGQSAPPTGKIRKVHVWWHHYDTGKGFYNPADEGQERTFYLKIKAEGTNEQGEKAKFTFYLNPLNGQMNQPFTMKIGDDVTCELNVGRMELPDGKVFTDVKLIDGGVMFDSDNRIYAASEMNTEASNEPGDFHLGFQMHQSMETRTKVQKATPDEIIMPEDIPFMNIEYWIEVSKPREERKVVINRGKKINAIVPFEEKTVDLLEKTNEGKRLILRAIAQGALNQFSPYYNGKYQEFFLCAEWAEGGHKDDLKKRYDLLPPEGNDLDGWTVTLKSNIRMKKDETGREEIPFETQEIQDSSLPEGTRKIIQQGVNGAKITYTVSYYVKDANGREETVKGPVEEIQVTEAVNQIVRVGTKKVTPPTPSVPSVKELVIFDANGGAWANGETRREYRSAVGSVISIEAAPTREGYKFLYWKGSEYQPGENYTVPAGGHTFVAQWEKVEKKPEDKPFAPSVDARIKTPRGSVLTADEIAKILASTKKVIPAIPKAGVGR